VKKKQEQAPSEQTSNDKDRMNPQVLLPNSSRLWGVPKGNPFAGSPMNLDFRRAMSSYLSTLLKEISCPHSLTLQRAYALSSTLGRLMLATDVK